MFSDVDYLYVFFEKYSRVLCCFDVSCLYILDVTTCCSQVISKYFLPFTVVFSFCQQLVYFCSQSLEQFLAICSRLKEGASVTEV